MLAKQDAELKTLPPRGVPVTSDPLFGTVFSCRCRSGDVRPIRLVLGLVAG